MRCDFEMHARAFELGGQLVPGIPFEHDAEVRNRHVVTIHGILDLHMRFGVRVPVRDELMAE